MQDWLSNHLTYKLLMEDEMLYDKNIHQTNKKAYECISEMNSLGIRVGMKPQ